MSDTSTDSIMITPVIQPSGGSSTSGTSSAMIGITTTNGAAEELVKKEQKGVDIESQIPTSYDDECTCCVLICACISTLAIVAAAIAYIVFGIMFLVQDYNVAHDCKDSSLWAYGLVAIILSVQRGNAKNVKSDDGVVVGVLICMGLIEAGLGIWGAIELFVKSCDDLSNTNLWKFCLATFVLQMFCAFLCLFVGPCIAIILACKKNLDKI